MIRRRIRHRTTYDYDESVLNSHHYGCLEPRPAPGQQPLDFALTISPEPVKLTRFADYFANNAIYFEIDAPHRQLVVETVSTIASDAPPVFVPPGARDPGPGWETAVGAIAAAPRLAEFTLPSPLIPALPPVGDLTRDCFLPGRPLIAAVRDLIRRIHGEFRYDPGATSVSTPLADVLRDRAGVCQDFAHLAIAALRERGLPARYVSGYLETRPPPGQPRLEGADASHAWFSVHCPGFGWIDGDPTNDAFPADAHATLAWGRDFGDVSPLKGVILGGGRQLVTVAVDVERLEEDGA
jgi:transglutaminase-like putative cysteine protease